MRVIVTGSGGFVGQALTAQLVAAGHAVVGIDQVASPQPGVEMITGHFADPAVLDRAFADRCDAVVHLATVPGGAAELDPPGARRTNVEATMALTEAAVRCGPRVRFLFASSIAVFGSILSPAGVNDATPLAPTMLYGAHKAMMEQWIATLSRRGDLDGLSLRLPGIVARSASPSGMTSAFMSDVFHALRERRPFVSPVSQGATMWLMSVQAVAGAFMHALTLAATLPEERAITLPAMRLTMADLVSTIATACAADSRLISYCPDPAVEAAFGAQPQLNAARAEALGFRHDGTPGRLAASALSTIATQGTVS